MHSNSSHADIETTPSPAFFSGTHMESIVCSYLACKLGPFFLELFRRIQGTSCSCPTVHPCQPFLLILIFLCIKAKQSFYSYNKLERFKLSYIKVTLYRRGSPLLGLSEAISQKRLDVPGPNYVSALLGLGPNNFGSETPRHL